MAGKDLEAAIAWERELDERMAGIEDVVEVRRIAADMTRERGRLALPSDIEVTLVDAGGVPAEWVIPPVDAEGRTILHAHGGGGWVGSPEDVREMLARIARRAQSRGLSLDYRLQPEHPAGAAVEDVVAAYRWLLDGGADPRTVALAGDSSGATFALGAALVLRDAGDPLPGAVVLLSPLDDETLDTDLTGLPPLLVQVGTAESALHDARRLVARARAHGVEVQEDEFPDMIHVWQAYPYLLDAHRATRRLGDGILQRIGPGSVPVRGTA